jgi:hypothetical protein
MVEVLPSPGGPENLSAIPDSQGILLQWDRPKVYLGEKAKRDKNVDLTLQFIIDRRSSGKEWQRISPTPVEENHFLDTVLVGAEMYDYRITSVLASAHSQVYGGSAEALGIRAPELKESYPPPHTVWVIPAKGGLQVRWIESDRPLKGYHVYRRQGGEIIRLTGEPIQHPPYFDAQVKPNSVYFYAVSAVSPNPPFTEGLLSDWAEIKSHVFE